MKPTLFKITFFPKGAKFSAFKHHFHVPMGLPRPRQSPHHFSPFFNLILSFKIKLKRKKRRINHSLFSKLKAHTCGLIMQQGGCKERSVKSKPRLLEFQA